jgi:hypothetical protein
MIQYSNVHKNRNLISDKYINYNMNINRKLMTDRLFNFSINKKKRQFKMKKDRIKKNRRLGLIKW